MAISGIIESNISCGEALCHFQMQLKHDKVEIFTCVEQVHQLLGIQSVILPGETEEIS